MCECGFACGGGRREELERRNAARMSGALMFIILFDLFGGPRLFNARGSRYPDFWFKPGKRANGQLGIYRKKYGMLTV
jgi:hypothetical protein